MMMIHLAMISFARRFVQGKESERTFHGLKHSVELLLSSCLLLYVVIVIVVYLDFGCKRCKSMTKYDISRYYSTSFSVPRNTLTLGGRLKKYWYERNLFIFKKS